MVFTHKRIIISLSNIDPDTEIRRTRLLDWRLRIVFWMNDIKTLRELSGFRKSNFDGRFLCNEKAITNMTLLLNCVKLDWME